MIRKSLLLGSCGALAIGLLAAAAQAAPGQVVTLSKSAQTNNLLTPIHRGAEVGAEAEGGVEADTGVVATGAG